MGLSFRKKSNYKNKLVIGLFILVAVGAIISVFIIKSDKSIPTFKAQDTIIEEKEIESKVSLSFIGDLLMHTAERKSGYDEETNTYEFDSFFNDIKGFFNGRDYIVGSFETPISEEKSDNLYSGYPAFKSPPKFIEAIKNAGINALVTSNNHVLDQGSKGAIKTMDWIEKYNIPYTGTYKTQEDRQTKPVLFLEKNNIKIALMNYTQMTNMGSSMPYIVNYIDMEKIKKDIEFAKASSADTIIVWLHFGNEYQRQPGEYQKKITQDVAKLGADIIIGSHPHVIQPMDVLDIDGRKVFVAYSLGNFISNQYWRYSTDGMILNIELEKKDGITEFKNINYIPTAVVREYNGPETKSEQAVKLNDKSSDFITGAISKGVLKGNQIKFRIVAAGQAMYDYENKIDENLTNKDYIRLKTTWQDTTSLIGETQYYKVYKDVKTEKLNLGIKP